MISKSKYVDGLKCEKSIWLEINRPDIEKTGNVELASSYGIDVGVAAKNYFGTYFNVERTTNKQMALETEELMKMDNVVITEASFIYNNLFCSVDILVKNGNDIKIYEVKSKKEPNKEELNKFTNDIAFQKYIIDNCGYNVTDCYLMKLNPSYILHNHLNLKQLFEMVNLTKEVNSINTPLNISRLREVIKEKCEPNITINKNCKDCSYFKYCTSNLPNNNIFKLNSRLEFNKKLKFFNQGLIKKEDILNKDISDDVKQQILFDTSDMDDFVDTSKLKMFLSTIKGSVYFLDFETYSNAIPQYEGDKVNEVIPFQYSLHYYDNGNLKHTEFLGDGINDPRRALAEKLVSDIPQDVCVIAYHKSVECGIIRNLAKKYLDLAEHLDVIANNIVDLEEPFAKRYFYTKNFNGRSSIKVILPSLCTDLDYSKLEGVHKGDEATNAYLNLHNLSNEEQLKLREQLLTYCSLDTYAMVRILEELYKILNK